MEFQCENGEWTRGETIALPTLRAYENTLQERKEKVDKHAEECCVDTRRDVAEWAGSVGWDGANTGADTDCPAPATLPDVSETGSETAPAVDDTAWVGA